MARRRARSSRVARADPCLARARVVLVAARRLLSTALRSCITCAACRVAPAGREGVCAACRERLWAGVAALPAAVGDVVHLGPHAGPLRRLVHGLKFRGERDVAAFLGALLGSRMQRGPWRPDLITHVPTDPRRLARRGYDQAALVARALAVSIGCAHRTLLVRARSTPRQAGLGRAVRRANVRGAFVPAPAAERSVRRARVLVVDDVLTTGASLDACREALVAAGAAEVRFAVVARTASADERGGDERPVLRARPATPSRSRATRR